MAHPKTPIFTYVIFSGRVWRTNLQPHRKAIPERQREGSTNQPTHQSLERSKLSLITFKIHALKHSLTRGEDQDFSVDQKKSC